MKPMRIVLKLFIVAIAGLILTSCAPKHADIVVSDFGQYKVTLGEFENAYAKNVGGIEAAEKDSVENYKTFLDLYVNYKMKLRDAYIRDYPNDEDLIAELNDYKEKVGVSYIEEKQIVSPGMKRFYDERTEEVRVSHIMIKTGANPDETLKKAESILDSIKNGKSFEEMVKKYSQDEFSKKSNGDIYWITAGQIIPSFEAAAFSTKVGEVYTEVVKTKFGYHILKVTDRQKRLYKIRAKHILLKNQESKGNMVDAIPGVNPIAKINKIHKEIIAGADFDSLAREYSDDPGSGAKGGDLGLFERRQMVQPFDEAVFKLKIGEVSDVVKTRFGFHLIKLVEVQEFPTYEKEIQNIREMYKKSRYQFDFDNYLDALKKEYKYNFNEELLSKLSLKENEITLFEEYKENEKYLLNKDAVLVSVSGNNYTIESFFEYLYQQQKYINKGLTSQLLSTGAKEYSNELLLRKKSNELENTDKEFASLMVDYKNGIFIFKLQEDEVWNKVHIDSVKLQEEYNKSKENFTIDGKVNFNEIFSKNKDKIESYYQMLNDGVDFDSVAHQYTERPGFKAKYGRHGFKSIDDSELSKQANGLVDAGNFSKVFATDGGWAIVILRKKVEPSIKTFEQALPELSSAFQESESKRLEKEYVDKLHKLYQPEYFHNELENAYKVEKK
jgi:peptidyl-prolyl cis-trans isomerase SurA